MSITKFIFYGQLPDYVGRRSCTLILSETYANPLTHNPNNTTLDSLVNTINRGNMVFELTKQYESYHLIPQSTDLALHPPQSYFFITDFLIITCGVLYTFCYVFYALQTYRDKFLPGTVQFLSATMAYEIYYAYVCTSTTFQRACFFVWFLFDITFVSVALRYAYNDQERRKAMVKLLWQVPAWMLFLLWCGRQWPDEREQKTAFWTGLYLELPIGWGQIWYLIKRGDTKGQNLEIWITRYLGCITAFLVFIWRYLNVPENWSYVASWWSIGGMIVTLLPETVYPFFYIWAHRKEKERTESKLFSPSNAKNGKRSTKD